jgi:hypothetical protein
MLRLIVWILRQVCENERRAVSRESTVVSQLRAMPPGDAPSLREREAHAAAL